MHRILSEQQQEFAQAFGLHDEHSSSEVSHNLIRIHPDESVVITLHFAVTHPASSASFISFCFILHYSKMYRKRRPCSQGGGDHSVSFFHLVEEILFSTL